MFRNVFFNVLLSKSQFALLSFFLFISYIEKIQIFLTHSQQNWDAIFFSIICEQLPNQYWHLFSIMKILSVYYYTVFYILLGICFQKRTTFAHETEIIYMIFLSVFNCVWTNFSQVASFVSGWRTLKVIVMCGAVLKKLNLSVSKFFTSAVFFFGCVQSYLVWYFLLLSHISYSFSAASFDIYTILAV